MTGSRVEVNLLISQFDHTQEEDLPEFNYCCWQSLIQNLQSVRPEDWEALPDGAERPIRELVIHVGKCYAMYDNHAFGDHTLDWSDTSADLNLNGTPEEVIAWLRNVHGGFRESLAKLTDDDLDVPTSEYCGEVPRR